MGLLQIVRNLRELARGDVATRSWTAEHAPEWVFDSGANGSAGVSGSLSVSGTNRPAEQVLMVFGCIVARREAIGSVPLRISTVDDRVVESGPFFELMQKPNLKDDWDTYCRKLETYSALYNGIAVAMVGDGSLPDELVPLSPGHLTPVMGVHGPTGTAVAVEWQYIDPWTGQSRIFRPEQLLIRQGFNPHAPLECLSPIKALRRTMQGELAAREQNLALFLNDSTPRGVLHTDKNITKEQSDQILERWEDKQRGFDNRHKTAVTWGGLKYEKIGLSPSEMEFLDGLKFLRTDYYIVFRVKPAMVNEIIGTELGQGNESIEAQKVQWWEDIGLAELDLIGGMHNELARRFAGSARDAVRTTRSLSRMETWSRGRSLARAKAAGRPQLYVWFDENSIPALVRHRLAKLDQLVKIVGLGWAPDAVNEYLDLGLPPHADNIARVPFSAAPIGEGAPKPESVPADDSETATRALDIISRIETLCREDAEIPARYRNARASFDAFIRPREKAAAQRISGFFVQQRGRVLKRLADAPAIAREELARADAPDEKLLKMIFPKTDESGVLIARLSPLWMEHLRDGGDYFAKETSTKNPFEIADDPDLKEALRRRQIQGTKINDTTEEDLRRIIGESFDAGDTNDQLADRIADYYGKQCVGEGAPRVVTAARTQTSGIVNEGRMIAAKRVGGLKKGWLHGGSMDPREAHVNAQERYLAKPIPLDAKFQVNGHLCDAPGSTELPVEEVANCTCMQVFSKE